MVDFGNQLKSMRIGCKMTQKELANKIGVTKSVISYYELQERTPSPEVLIKLAGVFNVSVDRMLGIERGGNTTLDVSGLDENDIAMVRGLVDHLRHKNDKIARK